MNDKSTKESVKQKKAAAAAEVRVRVSILILNIYTLNISWNKMSGTRNSFSHLTVEKTHTHVDNHSLLMSHTLFWRARHPLPFTTLTRKHTHSVNAHHFLFVTFHISLCVSSTHSNNASSFACSLLHAPFLFFCAYYIHNINTHTRAHTQTNIWCLFGQPNLMYARW